MEFVTKKSLATPLPEEFINNILTEPFEEYSQSGMKRILVITEEIALDSNVVIDAFVIDFGENSYTHEQLRNMLNLGYHQEVTLLPYKEGELGIRRVN